MEQVELLGHLVAVVEVLLFGDVVFAGLLLEQVELLGDVVVVGLLLEQVELLGHVVAVAVVVVVKDDHVMCHFHLFLFL